MAGCDSRRAARVQGCAAHGLGDAGEEEEGARTPEPSSLPGAPEPATARKEVLPAPWPPSPPAPEVVLTLRPAGPPTHPRWGTSVISHACRRLTQPGFMLGTQISSYPVASRTGTQAAGDAGGSSGCLRRGNRDLSPHEHLL